MTRHTYTLLLRVLAPLIWVWMAVRAKKAGGKWEILSASRFGHIVGPVGTASQRPVWIHAVSLGETRAATPLIQELLDRGLPVLLTHTTATGHEEGARAFKHAIASNQLRQTWFPYDFPGSVRRFLRAYQPMCGILIEREVWPNLIHEANRQGIAVLLVSARFSESSLRQAKRAGRVMRSAYSGLSMVLAQTAADADRLRQAGAKHTQVLGNMKFDVRMPGQQLDSGRAFHSLSPRPVITIASTREGEDAAFADAIRLSLEVSKAEREEDRQVMLASKDRNPCYLLVPRHPQRFEAAAEILKQEGLSFVRRSDKAYSMPDAADVLLGDSLGEMAFYYGASDVAIVAGGFGPFGGQNLIEACAAGCPVIVGPHMHNFAQATADAIAAGAALQVETASEAVRIAVSLLRDQRRLARMRDAATAWTATHSGATARIVDAIAPWLKAG